jgi:hypothetical protein
MDCARKTCRVCRRGFEPTRRDAVYCTAACRQLAYRERKTASTVTPAVATLRVPVPAVITIREPGGARREQQRESAPAAAPLIA